MILCQLCNTRNWFRLSLSHLPMKGSINFFTMTTTTTTIRTRTLRTEWQLLQCTATIDFCVTELVFHSYSRSEWVCQTCGTSGGYFTCHMPSVANAIQYSQNKMEGSDHTKIIIRILESPQSRPHWYPSPRPASPCVQCKHAHLYRSASAPGWLTTPTITSQPASPSVSPASPSPTLRVSPTILWN